jgi:hypothetical protein
MIVEQVTSKTVTTKFGPKPAYSIKCDGEWFSYGFKKPAFSEGASIEFTFTENTYGKNVDAASLRVISSGSGKAPMTPSASSSEGGGATPAAAPAGRSYGAPAKVFPIPALHGDRAIVRQNSLTNAVNMLKEDKDLAKLTGEARATYVISVARMFEAYSCGDLDMEMAKEMATKE